MAVFVFIGIAVVVTVLMVAAVAVLRESAIMDRTPPTRAFDKEEALAFVVEHIPESVGATLTIDDAGRIIDLQLEYFRRTGVSRNGSTSGAAADVVVGGSETVEFILHRAAQDGAQYTSEQVHAVVETQLAYLRSIGVIGPRAEGGGRPGDPETP